MKIRSILVPVEVELLEGHIFNYLCEANGVNDNLRVITANIEGTSRVMLSYCGGSNFTASLAFCRDCINGGPEVGGL